jgi:hypothetical protein
VLAAVSPLAERGGGQAFTMREAYGGVAVRGTLHAEPTVFKTMQRMKEGPVRPPCERLERVSGQDSGL